jgi:hypothetical protein
MRVQVSDEAADFVAARGGTVWIWAHRPGFCCGGTAVTMRASTTPPPDEPAFTSLTCDAINVRFRAPGGRFPEVLEIALHGRRRPRVEAYWDGCLIML